MKLSEFDYNLPKKYIAQIPAEPRDYSKLMVLDRTTRKIAHRNFYDIVDYFKKGDISVVNNSKVMAARLFGRKSTGARVEVLLLHKVDKNSGSFIGLNKNQGIEDSRNDADNNPPALTLRLKNNKNFLENGTINIRKIKNGQGEVGRGAESTRKNIWRVLVRPAKRLRVGDEVIIDVMTTPACLSACDAQAGLSAQAGAGRPNPSLVRRGVHPIKMKIIKELEEGMRLVEFNNDIRKDLDNIGMVPLPPYIKSDDASIFKKRYQTVYSKVIGSAAAPTAGLHFTQELIKKLKEKGVSFKEVTLHIGLDTFRPITAEKIEDHKIHVTTQVPPEIQVPQLCHFMKK
ncbi:MAG: S-adenosylmethionine:tRNA ribosyltransferase-isomerase [bacterium]